MTRIRSQRGHGWWICSLLLLACALPGGAQETSRKIVKKVDAQYPTVLKRRGIGGTVRLKVFIKPDGTVRDTEVIGGNPVLVDAAQKAVVQWRFSPSESETVMQVSMVFDPDSSSQ